MKTEISALHMDIARQPAQAQEFAAKVKYGTGCQEDEAKQHQGFTQGIEPARH